MKSNQLETSPHSLSELISFPSWALFQRESISWGNPLLMGVLAEQITLRSLQQSPCRVPQSLLHAPPAWHWPQTVATNIIYGSNFSGRLHCPPSWCYCWPKKTSIWLFLKRVAQFSWKSPCPKSFSQKTLLQRLYVAFQLPFPTVSIFLPFKITRYWVHKLPIFISLFVLPCKCLVLYKSNGFNNIHAWTSFFYLTQVGLLQIHLGLQLLILPIVSYLWHLLPFLFTVHVWRWYWGRGGPWTGCAGGWGWVQPPLTPIHQRAPSPIRPTTRSPNWTDWLWCRYQTDQKLNPLMKDLTSKLSSTAPGPRKTGLNQPLNSMQRATSPTVWKNLTLL